MVYAIDAARVLKYYYGEEDDIAAERQAFARLSTHSNTARHSGTTADRCV